ncbi:DUF2062 domain-containing protein [Altererythrobacter sp.]|uniref:DUF2062 domain-containing protein n=1 Tax=Altererythrobacter sp. TaxID=1872480 RepID=UPI003D029B19
MSTFGSKTWLADTLRSYMPSREDMARNRFLAPIAHRFLSPELWRFTRRSVPRGVALGLFAAFIVPIGQIFLAAFLALPARANVPLSAAVTFVTNPFTLPFWLVVANRVGAFVLKVDAVTVGVANDELNSGRWAWVIEAFQVAGVTTFGFIVLSVVSAAIGYLLSSFLWRYIVARKRARRLRKLEARLDERLKAQKG